jgi:uncharacterized surface protein with fasciclin (FAS1) repeats
VKVQNFEMKCLHYILSTLLLTRQTLARSFLEAISTYPELSKFTSFFASNINLSGVLFSNPSLYPITVLVPNNNAFAFYQRAKGVALTSLPVEQLLSLIQYHTLISNLSTTNFTVDGGLTAPTLLTREEHNNRTAGPALAAQFGGVERSGGQVVFIHSEGSSGARRFVLRQGGISTTSVRSGRDSNVNITVLEEGTWEGGRFHIVDSLLTIPETCSNTIRGASLSSLDTALTRSELWPALDHSSNVTCLGPNNAAFASAGNPDTSLNKTALSGALLFHTLPEVAYSNLLTDGQTFTSLANLTVKVKVTGEGKDRQIYFNNAKVIDANVL